MGVLRNRSINVIVLLYALLQRLMILWSRLVKEEEGQMPISESYQSIGQVLGESGKFAVVTEVLLVTYVCT